MASHLELRQMLCEGLTLVTVNVLYYMPDQQHMLNEFLWETLDLAPRYPRVQRFLDFWEREIEGRIKAVTLVDRPYLMTRDWRSPVVIPSRLI